MGQNGKPVIKYDRDGNQVAEYASANKAATENYLSMGSLYHYIKRGSVCDGFRYSFGMLIKKRQTKQPRSIDGPQPWERDGLFDVDLWGKALLY